VEAFSSWLPMYVGLFTELMSGNALIKSVNNIFHFNPSTEVHNLLRWHLLQHE
jgi:hypothetical protein